MVTKSEHVELVGRLSGGFLGGLARALLTNESMFLQELTATRDDNDVLFAPSYPGDLVILDLRANDEYILGMYHAEHGHEPTNLHNQSHGLHVFIRFSTRRLSLLGQSRIGIDAHPRPVSRSLLEASMVTACKTVSSSDDPIAYFPFDRWTESAASTVGQIVVLTLLQGLFLLRARGPGTLVACAYGAVENYTLRPGEIRDIDNGHLVAWTANTNYRCGLPRVSVSWNALLICMRDLAA